MCVCLCVCVCVSARARTRVCAWMYACTKISGIIRDRKDKRNERFTNSAYSKSGRKEKKITVGLGMAQTKQP